MSHPIPSTQKQPSAIDGTQKAINLLYDVFENFSFSFTNSLVISTRCIKSIKGNFQILSEVDRNFVIRNNLSVTLSLLVQFQGKEFPCHLLIKELAICRRSDFNLEIIYFDTASMPSGFSLNQISGALKSEKCKNAIRLAMTCFDNRAAAEFLGQAPPTGGALLPNYRLDIKERRNMKIHTSTIAIVSNDDDVDVNWEDDSEDEAS